MVRPTSRRARRDNVGGPPSPRASSSSTRTDPPKGVPIVTTARTSSRAPGMSRRAWTRSPLTECAARTIWAGRSSGCSRVATCCAGWSRHSLSTSCMVVASLAAFTSTTAASSTECRRSRRSRIPVRLEATEDGHPEREGQQSVGTDRGRTAVAFILADRERSVCLTTSPGTSAAGAAQTPDRPGVGDQSAPHDSRDHMIPGTTKDVDGRHPTKIAASGRFSGSPRIDAEPVAEYALPGQALRSLSGSGVVAEVRLNDSGRR